MNNIKNWLKMNNEKMDNSSAFTSYPLKKSFLIEVLPTLHIFLVSQIVA